MSARTAHRLVSPHGFSSANVDGVEYVADEHGVFHVQIPAHVTRLKGHPFNMKTQDEQARVALAKSEIDLEKASIEEIEGWLRANGVDVPVWRTVLVHNAQQVLDMKAAGAAPESIEGAGLVDPEETMIRDRPDGAPFDPKDATWAELKAFLTKNNVPHRGNDPKSRLARLAEDFLASEAV